jgi:hypothetical protein
MVKPIEEILGKLERERAIPGTRPGESETVRYVSLGINQSPSDEYKVVIMKISPPLMKSGGVMLEGCILTLPDGTCFYPLILNGDIPGWQKQIEQGASSLGLLTAKIAEEAFLVSDGRSYPLSECSVEFD